MSKTKNIKAVEAAEPAAQISGRPPPTDLDGDFAQLYVALISEVSALRGAATRADHEMAATACRAAQGEFRSRELALFCYDLGDGDGHHKHSRMAQSEARGKAAALAALHLTGDRRGASKAKQAAYNAQHGDDGDDEWADL